MTLGSKSIGLPLLVKELVEQAARRRTYVVRVIYAALLFLAFGIYFHSEVPRYGGSPFQLLGIGKELFEFLLGVQLTGIYLFLPAMVSSVITYEKERRSLELLFITDLGPWEIVLQKLGGRLVPMLTFLLLALPLMAVTYSFGGVDSGYLALGAYVLFATCLQLGAFALMMSAYFRTSSEALLATYAGGIGLFAMMGIVTAVLGETFGSRSVALALPLLSVAPFFHLLFPSMGAPFSIPAAAGLLPWAWTVVFLLGARRFLLTRAFVPAKRRRSLFKMLDGWISKRRRRAPACAAADRRGGRRSRYAGDLPGEKPIAWREVTRTSLGSPGRFAFTSLVLGVPLLAASFLLVWLIPGRIEETLGLTMVIFGVWVMAALSVAVRSASAFALERTSGTLDLLLTTPLTGREIVGQKAGAVRRHVLFLMVLLGILFLIEAMLESEGWHRYGRYGYQSRRYRELGPGGYLATAILSVPIFLSAIGWVARWIGLRVRGRTRATTITLGVIFAWCVGPFLLAPAVASLMGTYVYHDLQWLYVLSPGTVVVLAEIANLHNVFHDVFRTSAAFPVLLSFALHVGIALVFRALCLRNADRYLGRAVPAARAETGPAEGLPSTEEASRASAGGAKA